MHNTTTMLVCVHMLLVMQVTSSTQSTNENSSSYFHKLLSCFSSFWREKNKHFLEVLELRVI